MRANTPKLSLRHSWILAAVLLFGTLLRFWQLDAKPLWLDEAITALMALRAGYDSVPLETVVPLKTVVEALVLKPGVTCPDIARALGTDSTHPPLFFCWLHHWLGGLRDSGYSLAWQVRSLSALFGVGAIAASYSLNRLAFSPQAGLGAAALMAVSPFAIYLSQEARHYTLAIVCITLALIALLRIQQQLCQPQQLSPWGWLGWIIANTLGLYVHYFCLLALVAQVIALLGSWLYQRRRMPQRVWLSLGLALATIAVLYLPWLPTFFSHFNRPETSWVPPPYNVSPFYQTLAGWFLMVTVLPVEYQSPWIAVPCGLLMLGVGGWVGVKAGVGLGRLWRNPASQLATLTLVGFTGCVMVEFFAIAYGLGKDLTSVPRYNFVYYPGFCALLAASLSPAVQREGEEEDRERVGWAQPNSHDFQLDDGDKRQEKGNGGKGVVSRVGWAQPTRRPFWAGREGKERDRESLWRRFIIRNPCLNPGKPLSVTIIAGIIGSFVVTSGLAFYKPFLPNQITNDLQSDSSLPLEVVVSYRDFQDIALGLSIALALNRQQQSARSHPEAFPNDSPISWAFLSRADAGYNQVWDTLAALPPLNPPPLSLWIVAPNLRRRHYPPQLFLPGEQGTSATEAITCRIDRQKHYRIGIPYQRYRCDRASLS